MHAPTPVAIHAEDLVLGHVIGLVLGRAGYATDEQARLTVHARADRVDVFTADAPERRVSLPSPVWEVDLVEAVSRIAGLRR